MRCRCSCKCLVQAMPAALPLLSRCIHCMGAPGWTLALQLKIAVLGLNIKVFDSWKKDACCAPSEKTMKPGVVMIIMQSYLGTHRDPRDHAGHLLNNRKR